MEFFNYCTGLTMTNGSSIRCSAAPRVSPNPVGSARNGSRSIRPRSHRRRHGAFGPDSPQGGGCVRKPVSWPVASPSTAWGTGEDPARGTSSRRSGFNRHQVTQEAPWAPRWPPGINSRGSLRGPHVSGDSFYYAWELSGPLVFEPGDRGVPG